MSAPRSGDDWDRVWASGRYGRESEGSTRAASKAEGLPAAGLQLPAEGRLLDLGCGSGDVSLALAARGLAHARFFGCDLSFVALARARQAAGSASMRWSAAQAEATRLPFAGESFDVVIAAMLLQHLDDRGLDAALGDVHRVLRIGGRLLIIVPGRFSVITLNNMIRRALRRPPYDRRRYTRTSLDQKIRPQFRIDSHSLQQVSTDRPVAAIVDRAIAAVVPGWGRYLVASCSKLEGMDRRPQR